MPSRTVTKKSDPIRAATFLVKCSMAFLLIRDFRFDASDRDAHSPTPMPIAQLRPVAQGAEAFPWSWLKHVHESGQFHHFGLLGPSEPISKDTSPSSIPPHRRSQDNEPSVAWLLLTQHLGFQAPCRRLLSWLVKGEVDHIPISHLQIHGAPVDGSV